MAGTVDHYCTLDDVNRLVPQAPFTASSKPSADVVTQMVEQVATRMDATLANIGYVVPIVTGPLALALLREACAWGVLGLAQSARQTGVVQDGSTNSQNVWLKEFAAWLKKLGDPLDPFELPDAARNDNEVVKPGGNVLSSTPDDPGLSSFTYAENPPFYAGQKF